MTTQRLRILIAEKRHSQRLLIEKRLNLLGQYRIAPVASYHELDVLTQADAWIFDLVIVNASLATEAGVDMADLIRRSRNIRSAYIYDLNSLPTTNTDSSCAHSALAI